MGSHRVASINNRCLDLERLGPCRISRFIRDPRDLVVSGYFYHQRGTEDWVKIRSPTPEDWYFANSAVPEGLRGTDLSFAEWLSLLAKLGVGAAVYCTAQYTLWRLEGRPDGVERRLLQAISRR